MLVADVEVAAKKSVSERQLGARDCGNLRLDTHLECGWWFWMFVKECKLEESCRREELSN